MSDVDRLEYFGVEMDKPVWVADAAMRIAATRIGNLHVGPDHGAWPSAVRMLSREAFDIAEALWDELVIRYHKPVEEIEEVEPING